MLEVIRDGLLDGRYFMKVYRLQKKFSYQAITFKDEETHPLSWKINGKTSIKEEWSIRFIKYLDTRLKK